MNVLELTRYLFLIGALPFIVLGLAHIAAIPQTPADTKGLSPRDPAVRDAMARDSLFLTRRTTLWLAWVGFNLSHSLGAVVFGVAIVLIGRSSASFEAQASVFLPLSVLVSVTYLVLAVRFWFRTPIIGISLATVCFLVSWLLYARAG